MCSGDNWAFYVFTVTYRLRAVQKFLCGAVKDMRKKSGLSISKQQYQLIYTVKHYILTGKLIFEIARHGVSQCSVIAVASASVSAFHSGREPDIRHYTVHFVLYGAGHFGSDWLGTARA